MNNTKTTKRALLSSVIAMLLCVTMLIGTTFAWFTDSASTAVNKIQAGTLDVALEMKNADGTWVNAEGQTLSWKKAAGAPAGEQVLWEPGCTYELPELRIVNKGNLALKYKIVISGIVGDAELLGAIDFTYGNGIDINAEVSLAPNTATEGIVIKGHMKETAGNEYQGLSIDGIGITVVATQYTYEKDSIDDQYDATAEYPIAVAANVEVNANNKVIAPVTVESAEKVGSTNTPVAKVTVPANAAVVANTNQLALTIDEVATPANFVANIGTATKTFEVDMKGLDKDNNTELFKVEIYVGTGLGTFKLYHNGTAMTKKSNLSLVTDDQQYYYNTNTGVVTFLTKTFSPFTASYDKDRWENHAAESYATPVDTTAKTVTIASAEELALFAKEVSSTTNYSNYTVNITNDIDLIQYAWKPINGWGRMSNIVFNGNNHTIDNMIVRCNYNGNTGDYGTGFIGNTNGAITFNNITFKNADVSFYKSHFYSGNVGGIVMGYTYGTTLFNNVSVIDSTIYGFGKIGAILGMGADPGVSVTFNNCVSQNNTIAAVYDMGGLAGLVMRKNGQDNTTVNNCTVEDITVKLSTTNSYKDLNNVTATYKSNDKSDGDDLNKNISGNFWINSGYYWGGYADYYVSYGDSSYDAPVITEGYNMCMATRWAASSAMQLP